jgi:hypothetical protein
LKCERSRCGCWVVYFKCFSKQILFSEREAGLVSTLPIKPFNARKAAAIWKMNESGAKGILNDLADRGLLVDTCSEDNIIYSMPTPMAGFFEFSLMRYRNDIDQKSLSELYYQYMNVEEDFIKDLFVTGQTRSEENCKAAGLQRNFYFFTNNIWYSGKIYNLNCF